MNHICGAGLAFLAFSATLVIGLWVHNPFVTIITRALQMLVLFYLLGYVLAAVGIKAVQENFEEEVKQHQASQQESVDVAEEVDSAALDSDARSGQAAQNQVFNGSGNSATSGSGFAERTDTAPVKADVA